MRALFAGIGLLAVVLASAGRAQTYGGYDPLAVASDTPQHVDLTVKDEKRSREIPIRVYLPKDEKPAAVVLFSHGLGGSRENSPYLGNQWAQRGYVCVFMQHHGSDEAVWKDAPVGQRMAAMEKAAGLENFRLRVADVPAVLDRLELWNTDGSHTLAGRMDLKHVGMSGHSFGAVTTQAVSGQSFPLGISFTDARITAAVMMSPSSPRGSDVARAFASVKIPWMLLTGTRDEAPIGKTDVKSRLAVFPALPPGGKYELVLNDAEHSAFSDRPLPGDTQQRNPNHHRAIQAVTTAFWDAYLKDNAAAKAWLDGDDVRSVLEKDDNWQRK